MKSANRNQMLDIVKGIGILLVVLGHTMSPVMQGHNIINWIYEVIYTFHMPLFFFVSGYVASKLVTKPVPKNKLLTQRMYRLLIPYTVWALIYLPMKAIMSDQVRFTAEYKWYTFFLGNNPDGQLWYLYVLFVLSVITIFLVNKKTLPYVCGLFMLCSILSVYIPFTLGFTSLSISFSLYQSGFFFLGLMLSIYGDFQKLTTNLLVFIISCIVVVSYAVLTFFKGDNYPYLKAFVAVCAIYVCLYISHLLTKTKLNPPLSYLGTHSMEIYILHGPLLVIGRIVLPKLIPNVVLYIIVLTIISIAISILMAIIINKIKVARMLLFGSK